MRMELSFTIIDDSELDCFIARKIIEHTDARLIVQTFQDAVSVVEKIRDDTLPSNAEKNIILLDLQMPLMNGFQFVEEFEKLPAEIQRKYLLVVLSSTRNSNDIFRVLAQNSVHSFLEKPFSREKLFDLIAKLNAGPL
jgi:CheY-like chemotaxis protein